VSAPELDVDGPAAPPRSNGELAFDAPWQRRLFATTMALCAAGALDYREFRRRLIREIGTGRGTYWASWQDALEGLLAERDLCAPDELAARAERFAAHGGH
jgi:hypothetical protein